MSERIAILGATSAIAQAFARRYAAHGASFHLAGRSRDRLDAIAADLRVRGAAQVDVAVVDFADLAAARAACHDAKASLATIDIALVAHGTDFDQAASERDAQALDAALAANLTSHLHILLALASILEAQRSGTLVAMGSAAGDRGKARNYVYGSAKAAIAVLQQGLMARLAPHGARALLVKPAFVDTPMTAGLPKGALWITPDRAAAAIAAAVRKGKTTVYVPWYWRFIMMALRALPNRLFVRLGL